MTTITAIQALPSSPYEGSGLVAVVITSGIPSYFRLEGIGLDGIISVRWFPRNPASVQFEMRELILVDDTVGTFMIRVTNNFLDTRDRAGMISFEFDDGTTFSAPVITYGPVSVGPLWQAPGQGLITG